MAKALGSAAFGGIKMISAFVSFRTRRKTGIDERADIFDTAVLGFFAPAFGGSFHRQAAGVDFILAQGFPDPCLRGQCCYCPSVFVVLLNVQAMSLGGSFEFQVMVILLLLF